ncbi:response regulator [Pseudobacteriovorax antillogorgiicola]|uniref:Tetratricopeptide repeat-containing protein n=1 Tax=Pseudobacteriovorax antillogorgiicola TaxID=1513793 RepID=A0A1Y6CJJ2_9BACT|nr:response regulator [Pseudobacteriovorax antillogorgiicola]TCS46646.1 tetratricopeptide repeat protein [Pseudobacteriovorax antillogorgiicola]SMF66326.1 Tetratricopeptide repeat-containing protein [Pseudobacteriovorax antillogorgiicola]
MESFFKEKDGKVIVVDPSGAARTLLAEVVRSLGFGDVNGVAGIKEAVEMMEVEPIRWIVTPLMADQQENGMKLLDLFCNHPALKNLRVSFLLEESEQEVLPDAFERGLLSYHSKPFTKDSLTSELSGLFKTFEAVDWNGSLLAAHYLRTHMMEAERYQELLVFEKKLLDLYPGHLDQMFHTVPPLAKMGQTEEALSVLKQIKVIDSNQEDKIQSYLADYFEGQSLDQVESDGYNFLGLKKILLVDNDDSVANEVVNAFKEMGVEDVVVCNDGEAGTQAVQENEDIDLVIQEWRIPKLTGPLFLQKVQEESKKSVPIVLLSSLIEDQDIPFVKEMGVATMIKKPLKKDEFTKAIIWTIQQDRLPTEQSSMERKMRQFLNEKKVQEAQEIKERYIADSTIKIGPKEVMEAEFAYVQKEFEKARDFGIEAIKHAGDSIFILNLLGKTMMNLREFDVALKCFEKAQALAPMNLERLCQIAEVHSEMGNDEKAQETIEQAQDLDPDSERVKETSAKVALNAGDSATAKTIMAQLKAMENVVSYMNNQAVAMARCDMVNEGIQQYRTTLAAIPDTRKDIYAIVSYNLGLAHLRAGDMDGAQPPLEEAVQHDSVVKDRAEKLLKKVKGAIKSGKPLQVQKAQAPIPLKPEDASGDQATDSDKVVTLDGAKAKVLTLVNADPGDMACHLIFQVQSSNDKAQKLLSGNLKFTPREAILRGESGGADRAIVKIA